MTGGDEMTSGWGDSMAVVVVPRESVENRRSR